jgi:prolyl-tRNA synthetase
MSQFHAPTLREAPKDAELPSHQLLIRAGFIRPLTAGIYSLLPCGVRTVEKIKAIVREELDRTGAQEVLMPGVQPSELWKESGRWEKYGPELLRFEDRKGNAYCLGPTHEEVIVDLVRRDVRSYRQLPLNLYQIQAKFRDEIRPRGGLMRGREFVMKDAYSFDVSAEAAQRSYRAMYDAYERIFKRCGLEFRAVEADTGNIGGSLSHEFQVLAGTGEDAIVSCDTCTYAANIELARIGGQDSSSPADGTAEPYRAVDTPGKKTVEEVAGFLRVPQTALLKTLVVVADGAPWAAVVRGDHELNLIKVRQALGATEVGLADDATVERTTRAPVGFAGPVDLDLPIVIDRAAMRLESAVCGANQADRHLTSVVPGRDFSARLVADIRVASGGDRCPQCAGTLRPYRGIEVGHVFFLGTKYSAAMGCNFLDTEGKSHPMVMGCYGIGITRVMAAAVEQHHDPRGISWPVPLAPFHLVIVPMGIDDEIVRAASALYDEAVAAGLDVVLDDRDERPGVKLADADLIGFPYQVLVGKRGLAEGQLELKRREGGAVERVPPSEVVPTVRKRLGGGA